MDALEPSKDGSIPPRKPGEKRRDPAHHVDKPQEKQEMVAPSTPAHRVCMYHKPSGQTLLRIATVRMMTQRLVETIVDMCPPSPDRSTAIRHARDAMMSANASLVVDQTDVLDLGREPQVPDELLPEYKVR